MEALHLLNSLKHGGGENVAFNYAQVLATLNVVYVRGTDRLRRI